MKRIPFIFLGILLLALGTSCEREGEKKSNRLPQTQIVLDAINLTGDDRLNSVVRLSWYGTDEDGFITGYELSLDGANWEYTTEQDSLFNFELQPGSDSTDITFFVRAIDNDDQRDPTPAELIVPLKNTPPIAEFQDESFPEDTTNLVLTFRWTASDNDGDESIVSASIKVNDGDWFPIDVNQNLISLVAADPTANGATEAFVYYGSSTTPEAATISGFRNNDTNKVYIKVTDLADAESTPDTSGTYFVKPQTSDLLVIGGQSQVTFSLYRDILSTVYPSFDYVNYVNNGGVNQPKFWNPTFQLLINQYDKLFMFGDGTLLTNPINGLKNLMLGFAAPHLQEFSNNGGKSLIVNTFSSNNDISSVVGVIPLESLPDNPGQIFIEKDSLLVPQLPDYDPLASNFNLPDIDPFNPTADAEIIYNAQLLTSPGYTGPEAVAARRSNGNNVFQVYFSVPIYQFGTTQERADLFDQILNNDFNW